MPANCFENEQPKSLVLGIARLDTYWNTKDDGKNDLFEFSELLLSHRNCLAIHQFGLFDPNEENGRDIFWACDTVSCHLSSPGQEIELISNINWNRSHRTFTCCKTLFYLNMHNHRLRPWSSSWVEAALDIFPGFSEMQTPDSYRLQMTRGSTLTWWFIFLSGCR